MTTPTREQVVPDPSIRDAFERRFKEPPFEFSLERYGEQDAWPGNYKKFSEQCAWDGYQEARADLKATITEQAAEIERLKAELKSLKSDARAFASNLRGKHAVTGAIYQCIEKESEARLWACERLENRNSDLRRQLATLQSKADALADALTSIKNAQQSAVSFHDFWVFVAKALDTYKESKQ